MVTVAGIFLGFLQRVEQFCLNRILRLFGSQYFDRFTPLFKRPRGEGGMGVRRSQHAVLKLKRFFDQPYSVVGSLLEITGMGQIVKAG